MEAIKKPQFQVVYGSKDITKDISKSLISLTYNDAEEGETDDVSFEVEDTDGLWRDAWYPSKGDTIELSIGYDGVLLNCGKFVVDEIALQGAPDTVTIRGLAAATNSPLRTKRSTAHEKQTLKQIAEKIADKNGLSVQGEIANIQIERVTQNRESDLGFLARIAKEYGYLFSVRDKNLIFTSIYAIEGGQPVLDIDRTDLIRYQVTDKSVATFKAATVKYREPKTNAVVTATVNAGDKATEFMVAANNVVSQVVNPTNAANNIVASANNVISQVNSPNNAENRIVAAANNVIAQVGGANTTTSGDVLELDLKAENKQQATTKAQAALHRANTDGQDGNFVVYGEPLFVAGNNFMLTGMGKLSGKWHISKSSHSISRGGGYITSLEAKRIKDVDKPEQRKTPKRKPKRPKYKAKSGGGAGGLRSLDSDRV